MSKLIQMIKSFPELIPFSRTVIKIGAYLLLGYIVVAIAALLLSFEPECYMAARLIYPGAFEAGLGCFASSVVSALLCDIIYKKDIMKK